MKVSLLSFMFLTLGGLIGGACMSEKVAADGTYVGAQQGKGTAQMNSLYDFKMRDIDGKEVDLNTYRGKVVLVVNVASRCGYTPQYAGLEKLYEDYKDKGFVILGFPANNFGAQEPGTDEDIKTFCSTKYNVTFPIFSKISVKGDDKHPLYQFLTNGNGEVSWNFNKFLIDKNGKVVKHYESKVEPGSTELTGAIEKQLGSSRE